MPECNVKQANNAIAALRAKLHAVGIVAVEEKAGGISVSASAIKLSHCVDLATQLRSLTEKKGVLQTLPKKKVTVKGSEINYTSKNYTIAYDSDDPDAAIKELNNFAGNFSQLAIELESLVLKCKEHYQEVLGEDKGKAGIGMVKKESCLLIISADSVKNWVGYLEREVKRTSSLPNSRNTAILIGYIMSARERFNILVSKLTDYVDRKTNLLKKRDEDSAPAGAELMCENEVLKATVLRLQEENRALRAALEMRADAELADAAPPVSSVAPCVEVLIGGGGGGPGTFSAAPKPEEMSKEAQEAFWRELEGGIKW